MVDVAFVGEEGATVLTYAEHVDAEHVEAGDDEGREGDDCGGYADHLGLRMGVELGAEDSEDESDCQCAGVAHEDFFVFVDVAEYVVVEEGDEDSEGCEAEYCVGVFVEKHECNAVDDAGCRAESGCESVDAVDEVDCVDEEDEDYGCEGVAEPRRYVVDAKGSAKCREPYASADEEDGADDLDYEFGAIFDSDEVVGESDEVEELKSDECGE